MTVVKLYRLSLSRFSHYACYRIARGSPQDYFNELVILFSFKD